jgi:ABC-type sugar transport system permease subunit
MRLKSNRIAPYIFISPFFILFCVFGLYPIINSIYMSFFNWKLSPKPTAFIGFDNYKNAITIDPFFWTAMLNTVILLFTGSMLQHVISLPLAILINGKLVKGKEFFKTAFFLPYITSTVSVAIVFSNLFDTNYGYVNFLITAFGGEKVKWLQNGPGIKVVLSVILNWKYIGWNMVIYLAGLQAIPAELFEAAEIDGATPLQKHAKITIPLLLPIIFFAVSLSIIGGMQLFEEPFIVTGGYPNMGGQSNSGLTAAYYLMFTAFQAYKLGKGSAIAWILFVIVALMEIANRKITNRLQNR